MLETPQVESTANPPIHPTAILRSPAFAAHDASHHPENQIRLTVTERYLEEEGLFADRPQVEFGEAPLPVVEAIHDARYIDTVRGLSSDGGGWLDADTYCGPETFGVAMVAAGAVVAGVNAVLDGSVAHAFALVRPPGHHATPLRGMGFCLLNNVAIGAARALERGMKRVAIVDWDVHHGNGTQDAFYATDRVLFCSVHQSPFYPGTGDAGERGDGEGEGYTINVPVRAGRFDDDYLAIFDQVFIPALRGFAPELIMVSAGYDAHARDPLGGMRLTEQGFAEMTRRLQDVAEQFSGGNLVAVLEGGYDPGALARSVAATIRTLDGEESRTV